MYKGLLYIKIDQIIDIRHKIVYCHLIITIYFFKIKKELN